MVDHSSCGRRKIAAKGLQLFTVRDIGQAGALGELIEQNVYDGFDRTTTHRKRGENRGEQLPAPWRRPEYLVVVPLRRRCAFELETAQGFARNREVSIIRR